MAPAGLITADNDCLGALLLPGRGGARRGGARSSGRGLAHCRRRPQAPAGRTQTVFVAIRDDTTAMLRNSGGDTPTFLNRMLYFRYIFPSIPTLLFFFK